MYEDTVIQCLTTCSAMVAECVLERHTIVPGSGTTPYSSAYRTIPQFGILDHRRRPSTLFSHHSQSSYLSSGTPSSMPCRGSRRSSHTTSSSVL
eukprot:scaffold768_cov166-Amphora_coffeaeformis.AAC.8